MLRRREVEEREVQYYDLGSRTFGRSTSLVGVGSTPVQQRGLYSIYDL